MIAASLTGQTRLAARLRQRAVLLARAARAARRAGPAAWRRADWLWPDFTAAPPPASDQG